MIRAALIVAASVAISGCAEIGAFMLCGMANDRSQSYTVRTGGQKYTGTISAYAGPGDPGYVEPRGCMHTVSTRIKRSQEGKTNCFFDHDCATLGGKCRPDPAGGSVCQAG